MFSRYNKIINPFCLLKFMDSYGKKYKLGYGGLNLFGIFAPWTIVLVWSLLLFFSRSSYLFPAILTFSLPVPIVALVVFCILIWVNLSWFVKIGTESIVIQEVFEKQEIPMKDISKIVVVDASYYLTTYNLAGPKGIIPLNNETLKNLIISYKEKSNEKAIGSISQFFDKYSSGKMKLSQGKFFLIETISKTIVISPGEYDLFLSELREKYKSSQKRNLPISEVTLKY